MKKLRVGVVGVGYLGRFHAEKYARMDDVELVGVVDIDKSQAEEVAGRFNTKAYLHHEYLFGKVDAVSVVVPTPAHFSVAKDFLENNWKNIKISYRYRPVFQKSQNLVLYFRNVRMLRRVLR